MTLLNLQSPTLDPTEVGQNWDKFRNCHSQILNVLSVPIMPTYSEKILFSQFIVF